MDDESRQRPGPAPRRGVGVRHVRCTSDLATLLGRIAASKGLSISELLDDRLLAWARREAAKLGDGEADR